MDFIAQILRHCTCKMNLILILGLGFTNQAVSADWTYLLQTATGDTFYYDKTTIQSNGSITQVTLLNDYGRPDPLNASKSSTQGVSFYCDENKFQLLWDKFYAGKKANGKLLQSSNAPMPKYDMPNGSTWHVISTMICKSKTKTSASGINEPVFEEFFKNLGVVSAANFSAAGIAAGCVTETVIKGNQSAETFWSNAFDEHTINFPAAEFVGFFNQYIQDKIPQKHDPSNFDMKNGKYTKLWYRKFSSEAAEMNCDDTTNGDAIKKFNEMRQMSAYGSNQTFKGFIELDRRFATAALKLWKLDNRSLYEFVTQAKY